MRSSRLTRRKKDHCLPHLLKASENLGYVEGRNIALEHRFPNEIPERFKSMAADLVSLNVDALVGAGIRSCVRLKGSDQNDPNNFYVSS